MLRDFPPNILEPLFGGSEEFPQNSLQISHKILGSVSGRTDFSRIYIFGPPDFFADFVDGFFLLIFVGKVHRKILQENPRQNPPKFIQQKSLTHFCRGAGPQNFPANKKNNFAGEILQERGGKKWRGPGEEPE